MKAVLVTFEASKLDKSISIILINSLNIFSQVLICISNFIIISLLYSLSKEHDFLHDSFNFPFIITSGGEYENELY